MFSKDRESSQVHSDTGAGGAWHPRIESMLLVAACLTIYWLGNGQTSLWDRDEPRYAEAARVMLRTGDFIVPYFNDEFRFQKPVLTYWLVASAYWLFGDGEFAARFFSGIAVAGACLLTRRLGDSMFGRPAGVVAASLLALCPLMVILGKLCIPDGVQLFFAVACFTCLYRTHPSVNLGPAPAPSAALWFWICLGLSTLTKGPVVAGMIVATLAVYRFMTGTRWSAFHLRWRIGAVVLGLVTLPWLLSISMTAGPGFFSESVGRQIAGRAVESFSEEWLPPGYYLATLLLGTAPWLGLALLALGRFRDRWRTAGPVAFCLAWAVGPLILLELFQSKQMHYYAPSYPALAILAAAYLAAVCRGELSWRQDRWGRGAALSVWLLGGALAVAFAAVAWRGPVSSRPYAIMACATVAMGAAGGGLLLSRGKVLATLIWQCGFLLLAWMSVAGLVMPAMEPVRVVRRVAVALAEQQRQSKEPIVLHQLIEPSLVYYSRLTLPQYFDIPVFVTKARACPQGLYTVVSQDQYEKLVQSMPDAVTVKRTWHGWVKMHSDTVHLVRVQTPPAAMATARRPHDATGMKAAAH